MPVTRLASKVWLALLGAALTLLLPRFSAAKDNTKKAECATAYEKAQELRASAKLHEARDALVVCAQDACPSFVQTDCTQWLTEVQQEMPTVVFAAKDASGADVTAVTITMDGGPLASELDGKAVAIDPGAHQIHIELAGADPIDQQVVVREGEKDRVVEIHFRRAGEDLGGHEDPYDKQPADKGPVQPALVPNSPGPLRKYAYVAGGVGALGIIGWSVFGLLGHSEQSDLENSGCKPYCAQSKVDAIHTKYTIANVSLGVGAAGLGAGVVLFFLSRPKADQRPPEAGMTLGVKATASHALLDLSGRF